MVTFPMIASMRLYSALAIAALLAAATACQRVPLLAPSGSTITLTTAATTLPANGSVLIEAQVLEPAGTPPHSGTHITFTTTLGAVQPADVETDINGHATVIFNAGGASGTATITASSGGATTGTSGAIKIAIGAAAVGRIVLGANPGTVAGSGGNSTITASVSDANGNALPTVPVTFTTTAGSLATSAVTTDLNGIAQTTLTTSRTATVTATAGVQGAGTGTGAGSGGTGTGTGTGTGGTTSTQQSATVTVNVNTASTVTVGTPSPSAPTVGQAVTFGITYAQNANGSPVSRVIVDFGDGSPAQTFQGQPSAVSHTYNQIGSFTVRVTAFDTFGDTAAGSGNVTIVPRPQLVVTITSSTTTPAAGAPVTFTVTATPTTGNAISSVTIDFGDGTRGSVSGNASSLQHVYAAAGTYVVTAIATDTSGASGSATTVIVVGSRQQLDVAITLAGTATPTVGSPTTFTITAKPSTNATITSIVVNFGDGTSTTLPGNATNVTHTYTSPGTYTVSAVATDSSGASGSGATTIVVQSRPTPGVGLTSDKNPSTVNQPVTFTADVTQLPSGVTVDHFDWDFGDGSTRSTTSKTTSHVYTAPNTYIVSVIASLSDGSRTSSGTTEQRVNPVPAAASIR